MEAVISLSGAFLSSPVNIRESPAWDASRVGTWPLHRARLISMRVLLERVLTEILSGTFCFSFL